MTLDLETGVITITSALDFHGTAAFTYVVEHQPADQLTLAGIDAGDLWWGISSSTPCLSGATPWAHLPSA